MCYAVACCATHMIQYFERVCKFYSTTIYCAFQLKIAHFRRFEHNILWWQEKIHTSYKKLYKITVIFQLVFVLFAHNLANMRYCALRGEGVKYSSFHSFNKNPRYSRYSKQITRYWVDTRYSAELFHGLQDIRILSRVYKMEYGICLYTQDIGLNSEGGRGERVDRRIKPQDIVRYKI